MIALEEGMARIYIYIYKCNGGRSKYVIEFAEFFIKLQ